MSKIVPTEALCERAALVIFCNCSPAEPHFHGRGAFGPVRQAGRDLDCGGARQACPEKAGGFRRFERYLCRVPDRQHMAPSHGRPGPFPPAVDNFYRWSHCHYRRTGRPAPLHPQSSLNEARRLVAEWVDQHLDRGTGQARAVG